MAKQQSSVKDRQEIKFKQPKKYQVVMHNDDFTTMDFVVMVLVTVFRKSEIEAEAIMLTIHHSDKAVVGTYSLDIAASKAEKAVAMAREEGFPLRITVEPVSSGTDPDDDLNLPF